MLLRVSIPVEAGNAAAKAGTIGSIVEKILADLKPEAAYFFTDDDGQRSASIVFDMKDPSEIPGIAEPWFQAFHAKVSFRPIMNPQDLAKWALHRQGRSAIRKIAARPISRLSAGYLGQYRSEPRVRGRRLVSQGWKNTLTGVIIDIEVRLYSSEVRS
jgi:hypothetical protein